MHQLIAPEDFCLHRERQSAAVVNVLIVSNRRGP